MRRQAKAQVSYRSCGKKGGFEVIGLCFPQLLSSRYYVGPGGGAEHFTGGSVDRHHARFADLAMVRMGQNDGHGPHVQLLQGQSMRKRSGKHGWIMEEDVAVGGNHRLF